jgi:hypothetical protein
MSSSAATPLRTLPSHPFIFSAASSFEAQSLTISLFRIIVIIIVLCNDIPI